MSLRRDVRKDHPDWYNGAVPSFGADSARLLIVGLAPGLQGAHRTGRPFTGDASGILLFEMLERHGFSQGTYNNDAADTVKLPKTMITNAVRCVPPENRPTGSEINSCRSFLRGRIEALPELKLVLALGKVAHDSTVKALGGRAKEHPFGHDVSYQITHKGRELTLLSSFHCSRYNVNTRRLTPDMFDAIFQRARRILAAG